MFGAFINNYEYDWSVTLPFVIGTEDFCLDWVEDHQDDLAYEDDFEVIDLNWVATQLGDTLEELLDDYGYTDEDYNKNCDNAGFVTMR